jgi:hypothetical protein
MLSRGGGFVRYDRKQSPQHTRQARDGEEPTPKGVGAERRRPHTHERGIEGRG